MTRVFAAVNIGEDISTTWSRFPDFGTLVTVVVKNSFVLAGIITLILLIFGGFRIIVAAGSGDTKKLEEGKKAITGAVIGLLIVIGSFWIVQIVEKISGVPILNR